MSAIHSNGKSATPWGSVAAVLAACFATATGLVRGLDPEVILWRAIVAATLVGALVAVAAGVARWIQRRAPEK